MEMKDEFDKLWQVNDRKVNKQQAYKAFKKNYKEFKKYCLQNKCSFAQVYENWKVAEYKSKDLLDEEGNVDKTKLQFVCHLSTWLNGWRWEDEIIVFESEEEKWFNSYTGIIDMGASIGLIFDEEKQTFPEFKKVVFAKVPRE